MLRIILLISFFLSSILQVPTVYAAYGQPASVQINSKAVSKVSLVWQPIPGAVQYELNIADKSSNKSINDISQIYAAGYELDVKKLSADLNNLYWQVRGLNYYGDPVSSYNQLEPLANSPLNTTSPIPTTQFDKMDYTPVYPVYSWIPYLNAAKYDIRIYRENTGSVNGDKLIHEYQVDDTFDFYDPAAYHNEGRYYWIIQAKDANGTPISDWSKPAYFSVTQKNITTAALGDSITHGGGAISTPPGYTMYDWQTYCPVPVLNIGYSGDTTGNMLARFKTDVLPFKPHILVIMGGVNDIRTGIKANESIQNLSEIRRLCLANNIIPVMVTVSPVYPSKMSAAIGAAPADDWQQQLAVLNKWILSYPNSIDAAPLLTDEHGLLISSFTTDGLHPDASGKRIIGEAIGTALLKNYPSVYKN